MAEPTLQQCAIDYAGFWFKSERAFVAGLSSRNHAVRLHVLQRAGGYYRIARNMPTSHDVKRDLDRLAPALEVLDEPQFRHVSARNLREAVGQLRLRLAEAYGRKDLLSAATKFLWLLNPDSVIIYDSQVRRALGSPYADYEAFLERWHASYSKSEVSIRRACTALPSRRASISGGKDIPAGELKGVSGREWFRRRVYDIYMWRRGASTS